jgi:hypothetical protein
MRWFIVICLLCTAALHADNLFTTPITSADLDPAAFAQWVDGQETPVVQKNGPAQVLWTREAGVGYNGLRYGDSKNTGVRYLRVGWKTAAPVGAVLVQGGGQLSVLKSTAAYPGNLADDAQWTPAQRILNREVSTGEVSALAVWVLPPGTTTRAIRLAHTAYPQDTEYSGWLGGLYVLPARLANVAPQALPVVSATVDKARLLVDESLNGTWNAWDNGKDGAETAISTEHPEWALLTWAKPVTLAGAATLWTGFASAEVQAYTGPADRHPREAPDADWTTVGTFTNLKNYYISALGVNWLPFTAPVTTRALRLKMTQVTKEDHPHLRDNTKKGKRVWLGDLLVLTPLQDATLTTAILPPVAVNDHPPIPVRFTLKEAGYVTLVIEDGDGKRVRNLISETPFPAGENVAWWDGMDDLGRDTEAARHGIYATPGKFVAPGAYRVRGLFRKGIDLRYEFPIYTAGSPAWLTADNTGGWLTNHTPPSCALYVPAERSYTGKPLIYLGSHVSEGGHGLAWVSPDGKKVGGKGWIGGTWTGAQYLARDVAPTATGATIYVGSSFEKELRLTALTGYDEKSLYKQTFDSVEKARMGGLAVYNNILVCSLPKLQQVLVFDLKAGTALGTLELPDPRGLAFDAQGRLLALSGATLVRAVLTTAPPALTEQQTLATGLDDPQGLAVDDASNVYVSLRGASHQVKVFAADGAFQRAIGKAGKPAVGPYDPLRMNNPAGMAIDGDGRLWVTECDFQPKRVSLWARDGKLLIAYYGPSEYGGGGCLDPKDKTRFYYNGMEFVLDWKKGTFSLLNVLLRGDERGDMDSFRSGAPQTPLYANGRRYFTNCHNSNPTGGAAMAWLWREEKGVATPVAAIGRSSDWPLLKTEAFKACWPAGVDPKGDYWRNPAGFAWSDANDDGTAQPGEVTMMKGVTGGVIFMPDLSVTICRVGDQAQRFTPLRFTAAGAPVYDITKGETLATGVQPPVSSGGEQVMTTADGWTVITLAPKPYPQQSLCGVYKGTPRWAYPSLWPGLHASHESPAPEFPGELIGTTRLLGTFISPKGSDAGPLWAVNSNQGNMYLFTADGLFVANLFKDVRQGLSWKMPVAPRNMLLNDVSPHDENFWPTITQTADGNVYIVDGGRTSLVRVDGLDSVKRLPDAVLTISAQDLQAAQAFVLQREAARQSLYGAQTLTVPLLGEAPQVDGNLADWTALQWATIDKRGVAAYFNSNSKPYDVRGAVAVAGDRLFLAYRTDDPNLLRNSGQVANAPFKTGGALDVMLGVDPGAGARRSAPVSGDIRLLVTRVNGKTKALLYRAVVPGTTDPVPFSSPWRTVKIDRVEDISDKVQLANNGGDYEVSVPLDVLGLAPKAGLRLRGDLGLLRGDGMQTLHRVYWSNKATGITADVPSEAMLTPQLWGTWEFKGE